MVLRAGKVGCCNAYEWDFRLDFIVGFVGCVSLQRILQVTDPCEGEIT